MPIQSGGFVGASGAARTGDARWFGGQSEKSTSSGPRAPISISITSLVWALGSYSWLTAGLIHTTF